MTGTRQRRHRTGVRPPEITSGNPLQMLISQRLREIGDAEQGDPLSYQQAVDRGKDRRGRTRFSKATLGNILNGKTTKLTDPVVAGLAAALEVDEELVREAARQSSQTKLTLPARAKNLTPDQWDQLVHYLDFLLTEGKPKR